jgi:phage tail sheath protein FI
MPTIEETGAAPRAIEGVDTVVAFVGAMPQRPKDATRVQNRMDFETAFGACDRAGELGAAVFLFFRNDGGALWIAPSLAALEAAEIAPNLLALPGETDPAALAGAVAWAEAHQALVILEPPPSVATAAAAQAWLADAPALRSRNAAAYFPRIVPKDAASPVGNIGAVAGVMVREERTRGVWKAPAGAEAVLDGVERLALTLSDAEHQMLNDEGINALRALPGDGPVIWGARTLSPTNDEWKYVPVRRLAIYLERSLEQGLQWVVFEPNGPQLWATVQKSAERFLSGLFRDGALMGAKPRDAYFVTCDRTTMTQSDVDEGRLIVVVGFAPLRPAEFVILRIGLWTAGGCA